MGSIPRPGFDVWSFVGHEKSRGWMATHMSVDFEEHMNGSERVVIAFAGGPQNVYQFKNILTRANASFVLFRDTTQQYHLNGVLGIGDFDAVVRYIIGIKYHRKKVTTIGVSSGAYSALLYGQYVPVDEMIVFSALSGRDGCDDFEVKWQSQIVDPNTRCPDLRPLFAKGPIPKTRAFISDGFGTELDRQMVERIGITDTTVVPGFAHGELARGMRDMGMMEDLFK